MDDDPLRRPARSGIGLGVRRAPRHPRRERARRVVVGGEGIQGKPCAHSPGGYRGLAEHSPGAYTGEGEGGFPGPLREKGVCRRHIHCRLGQCRAYGSTEAI